MDDMIQTAAILSDIVFSGIIQPIKFTFYELFTLQTRQALIFLFIAYVVAYTLYTRRQKDNQQNGFLSFLGGKKVYLHSSALTDYQYYFIAPILHNIFIAPLLLFLFLPEYLSGDTFANTIENVLGPISSPIDVTLPVILVYSLTIFLMADFAHYWVHRIFHSGLLWEFHKVHHAAEVLTPITAKRVHFVETLVERALQTALFGIFTGIFVYIGAKDLSTLQILGATYLSIIFNSIAANLRHTHIWLSFGPTIEHIINSPAQHQIHHSRDPKHYDKNFGTNLSIWDWMFGTLYTTNHEEEDITYGITEKDADRLNTLTGSILHPFYACYTRTKNILKKHE